MASLGESLGYLANDLLRPTDRRRVHLDGVKDSHGGGLALRSAAPADSQTSCVPEPTVSVVIPTRDRAEMCRAAVQSAVAQAPAPLEVLVCDNGSTDATAEVIRALERADPRIRYLRVAEPTTGPGAPRNLGLGQARGDWVAFLDDDDLWLPGKLAVQAPELGRYDLVASNALRGSTGEPYLTDPPAELDHAGLMAENLLITSTVVVRAALLRSSGGFPEAASLQGVEDYMTWLAVAAAGTRIRLRREALVVYRDHGDDRFGGHGRRVLRQLAAMHTRRWLRRPLDPGRARAAASAGVTWVRDR
jgi:glycosyltransferase involved in cell wall biosynthesis